MATSTLLIGLSCLILGLLIGLILARTLHPKEQERKDLEEKLQQSQDQLKDYQQEVTEHFLKTSNLVNNLSHSYRDVHEHLATGAMRLTNTETSQQMIDAGLGHNDNLQLLITDMPEPPKDYAPKVPGGILSEEYGLGDDAHKMPLQETGTTSIKVTNDDDKLNDDDDDPTLDDPTLKVS